MKELYFLASMKKFIYKNLPFILIPLGILTMGDLYISSKLKNYNEYPWENEVWNDIYNQNIDADISIYGSSTAWQHLNPKVIEDTFNIPCYNFGMGASNFFWQYLRHREYLKFNNPPKLIILSVDINTYQKRETYQNANFRPYMLWNFRVYKNLRLQNKMANGVEFLIPMVRYIDFNKKNIFKSLSNINNKKTYSETFDKVFKIQKSGAFRYQGYRGINSEWTNDLEKAKDRFQHYKIKVDTTLIRLLEDFICEVNKKNINLIFVYAPTYYEGQSFVENRSEIVSAFERLSREHNIPFFDYSNSSICHEKDLFYNALHLNNKGAVIFTKKLVKDIQKHERTTRHLRNPKKLPHNNQTVLRRERN